MTAKMERLELTPLDVIMPRTYTRLLFTFRTTTTTDDVVFRLQNSLNTTMNQLPWLAGKVVQTTQTGTGKPTMEIRWVSGGQESNLIIKRSFAAKYDQWASAGAPLATIPPEIWPIAVRVDDETHKTGAPVLVASVVDFEDRQAIGLCICIHHYAADAGGFAEIVKVWARNHNNPTDTPSPTKDRLHHLSEALASDLKSIASKQLSDLLASHPEYTIKHPTAPTEFPDCTSKIFAISIQKINEIKKFLSRKMETPPTANTVLCAYLWSSITRVRQRRKTELFSSGFSRLGMAVNGRPRISPEFSTPTSPYFGNVNLFSVAESPVNKLCSTNTSSLSDLAEICNTIYKSNSAEQINSRHIAEAFTLISEMEDFSTLYPVWDAFNGPDLTITSWANLGLYETDFGPTLGNPEFIRVPYAQWDGLCIVLPRKRASINEGSDEAIEVVIMLRKDDLEALEDDAIWTRFIRPE